MVLREYLYNYKKKNLFNLNLSSIYSNIFIHNKGK